MPPQMVPLCAPPFIPPVAAKLSVAVSGNGKDLKVIVDFPEAGRKTVLPRFLRSADDQLN